ncbi:MAG: hypothetical protein CL607_23810 [Anaerolineaceae bacterium]|nr:hypothetical protein [Anaerolineaceae bacterium]
MSQLTDQCIEILQKTNDGDDLDPNHLKLVEMAVNGHLNERGEKALEELLEQVRSGYQKPWFHDIEHLTIDQEGFVYWRGKEVEHFNLPWGYSEEGKQSAEELAARCRHLECLGADANVKNAVWSWKEFADRECDEPDI